MCGGQSNPDGTGPRLPTEKGGEGRGRVAPEEASVSTTVAFAASVVSLRGCCMGGASRATPRPPGVPVYVHTSQLPCRVAVVVLLARTQGARILTRIERPWQGAVVTRARTICFCVFLGRRCPNLEFDI